MVELKETPPGPDGDGGNEELRLQGVALLDLIRPKGGPGPVIPGCSPLTYVDQGQYCEVYRATHQILGEEVAIKRLKKVYRNDAIQRRRLANEARALTLLRETEARRHVVRLLDRDAADEPSYLVLEWLENGSLKKRLDDQGTLEAAPAARIALAIAEATEAAHQLGIVHRDLKPQNILLTADGAAKVADFGVARIADGHQGLTHDGPVGTYDYMPPEQASGLAAEVGPHSDVYSIGAVLYACLTRRPPFQAASEADAFAAVVSDREPIPPEKLAEGIPRDLSTICLKCLRKDPKARYRSSAGLAEDLGRFLEGRPIRARRAGLVERSAKLVRRNKAVSTLVGLVLLSVAIGSMATRLYASRAERHEARAVVSGEQRLLVLSKVLEVITGDKLRRAGQRSLQVQLVGDLLPRFEEILQLEGNDPATRRLQGLAWLNLSIARRELGQGAAAIEAAENAEKTMRGLIAEGAFVEEATVGLATALGYRGSIIGQGGKFDDGIAALAESVRLLDPRANDETPALLERLAHAHNNWANCLRFGGGGTPASLQGADLHYRAAIDLFGRGARTLLTCRDWQARSLSNLALFVAETLKRPDDALPLARQAAELARGMLAEHPNELDCRECLATCVTNVAEIQAIQGRPSTVRPLFAEALALYERLSTQVPDSAEFRWSLAMAASNLGNSLTSPPDADLPQAEALFKRADLLYQKLVEQDPSNADLADYVAKNRERLDRLREASGAAPRSR